MVVPHDNNSNDTLDNALELVEDKLVDDEIDFAIKSILQLIPFIGGTLAELVSYRRQKIEKKRLRKCLKIFGEELRSFDKSKIDREFAKDEAFIDNLIMVFENSIRTRHIERMKLFCKILAGTLNKDKINDRDYAEDFQYFVANLTPTDIMVGMEIYKLQKHKPDHFGEGTPYKSEMDFV